MRAVFNPIRSTPVYSGEYPRLRYPEPPRLIEVSVVRFLRVAICVILLAAPVSVLGQGRRGTPPPTQTQTPPAGRPGQTPPAQNPAGQTSADQSPVFRTATVLVPVDVRVIDRRTRKPVTDLRQDEFIVTENNVRQQIKLFSTQALVPDES